jgi:hypothetical protein
MPGATEGSFPPLIYRYRITFEDRSTKVIPVKIDPDTLALVREASEPPPSWTRLGFHQCPNCPLDEKSHPHCPVAVGLVDVISAFQDRRSFEEVHVIVEAPNRTYAKHTTLQTAVSSLLGLFMPTSGCPILNKLRPMVDMHLPFQTREEAVFRLVSTYLAIQHILDRHGQQADWEMKGLVSHLDALRTVNKTFCERLNAMSAKDVKEALVILSTLGDFPNRPATEQGMERLERIVTQIYAQ